MNLLPIALASLLSFVAPSMPATVVEGDNLQARDAPLAGEHRILASDGAELYVKVAGEGPPCIFVHGGPGQGSASFEQMGGAELETFLTMIYLDQRGSGRSPDAADYSLDRVVQDIEEARRGLGVEKVCLISHSFGGILAVEYARRHPARVSELVMAFSTLHFISDYADRMQIDFVNQVLDRDVAPPPGTADRALVSAANDEARSALMARGQGYRFLTHDPATTRRMSEVDGSYARSRGFGRAVMAQIGTDTEYYRDYAPATAGVEQPVLVIAGRRDYAVGPEEHLRFRFPDQTVVVLDTGHLGYFDDNEAFVAAIRDFMRRRPAASASPAR